MKISIIIPVYNAKLYLNKCLDSVINQTYNELEIIIINDGSTDGSKEIIDNYSDKDERIIVIHKENGGIGSAYKVAFKIITGEYVLFVDSDDWLELNTVEELKNKVLAYNPDIVYFGSRAFDEDGNEKESLNLNKLNDVIFDNKIILKNQFEIIKHPSLVRLFKANLFNEIEVFKQNIGIDEMLTPQLLLNCTTAVYVPEIYYNLLLRNESVCRMKFNDLKVIQTLKVYRFLIDFYRVKIKAYEQFIIAKYIKVLNGILIGHLNEEYVLNSNILSEVKSDFSILTRDNKFFKRNKYFSLNQVLILRLNFFLSGLVGFFLKVKRVIKQ